MVCETKPSICVRVEGPRVKVPRNVIINVTSSRLWGWVWVGHIVSSEL